MTVPGGWCVLLRRIRLGHGLSVCRRLTVDRLSRIRLCHIGLPAVRRTIGVVLGCRRRLLGIAIRLRRVRVGYRLGTVGLGTVGLGTVGVGGMLMRRVRLNLRLGLNRRRKVGRRRGCS